jgi:hypothetical protein
VSLGLVDRGIAANLSLDLLLKYHLTHILIYVYTCVTNITTEQFLDGFITIIIITIRLLLHLTSSKVLRAEMRLYYTVGSKRSLGVLSAPLTITTFYLSLFYTIAFHTSIDTLTTNTITYSLVLFRTPLVFLLTA